MPHAPSLREDLSLFTNCRSFTVVCFWPRNCVTSSRKSQTSIFSQSSKRAIALSQKASTS